MALISALSAKDWIAQIKAQILPGLQQSLGQMTSPESVETILDAELPKAEDAIGKMLQDRETQALAALKIDAEAFGVGLATGFAMLADTHEWSVRMADDRVIFSLDLKKEK